MTHLLRSPLLDACGVRHGFNLRTGGSSTGGYASFNLSRHVGDDPTRVAENHQRFARAVGFEPGTLYESAQVHGSSVRGVGAADRPGEVRAGHADALVAFESGVAIGVRVADCVPLLVADLRSGGVAAIHAGWRGVCAGVVEAGLSALRRDGAGQGDALRAAIFPHIGPCCFEVGDEVAEALLAASPDPSVVDRTRVRPHCDLRAIVCAKLEALGVAARDIESVAGCTRCDASRFFSFRRDGEHSGRHIAAIVAR